MVYHKLGITNKRSIGLLVVGCLFLAVLLGGCAGMRGGIRSIAGTSTKEIENSRGRSIKKVFKYDYFSCYAKTQDILRRIGAYIYAEDKKQDLIAIYVSKKDTTPVGLFFQDIDSIHTQIEVCSPSTFARDLIAEKIFASLETSFNQDEKKK